MPDGPPPDDSIIVEISTLDSHGPLVSKHYVARTIGEALNAHAPDPGNGSYFEVRVIGRGRVV